MNQKKKPKRKVISYVLALMMLIGIFMGIMLVGVSAKAAETTVTTVDQLKNALEKTGGKVVLGADITITEYTNSIVNFKKEIVLDLNGYTLELSNWCFIVISNKVTICDSSSGETGKIIGVNEQRVIALDPGGSLTLESGTLESIDETKFFAECLRVEDGGSFHMTGGTIKGKSGDSIKCQDGSSVRIDGGTVINEKENAIKCISGSVRIEGGTVNGSFDPGSENTIIVRGGEFNFDPSSYLKESYIAANDGGYWSVGLKEGYSRHDVTVETVDNGSISVDMDSAAKGEEIRVSVTSAKGYRFVGIKDQDGQPVELNNKSRFTMPDKAITLIPVFEEIITTVTTEEELINAANNIGWKIILGADITVTDELAFNHETYLDLNGHVLTNASFDDIILGGNIRFTLSDSVGGGRFLIINNNSIRTRYDSATMVLESGSVEAPDSDDGTIRLTNGTFIMNGGIVSGTNAIARGGNITINGGTVDGEFLDEGGNLTITGGKFGFDVSGLVPEGTTVEKIGRHWYVGESAKDVEYDYIEPLNVALFRDGNTGYYISKSGRRYYSKNEDGTYVEIKEGDWIISAPVIEVSDEDSFNDAKSAGTKIKLSNDIKTDDGYISIDNTTTLDLNGHTLTLSGLFVDARVFTILDSKGGGKISFMGGEYGDLDIYGDNTTVILEGGTIEEEFDTKNAVITIEDYYNARFIMKGGTVSGKKIFSIVGEDGAVEIHDGTVNGDFSGTEDYLTIKGGRFSFDPIEYVDIENYIVSKDGDYWVVNSATYAVSIDNNIQNGAVSVDKAVAAKEDTVNVIVTPAEGYELDTLTVTDADGQPVETEDNQFTMPGKAVTVSAVFTEKISDLEKAIQEAEKYIADNLSDAAYADVKKDVEAAIAAAKTLGEDATDEQVQEVITSLNQAQDTAKLNVAKIDAKAELDKLLSDENKAKYDDAEWEELKKAVEAGKKAIDEATSIENVTAASELAVNKTSEIKTIAVKQEEINEVNNQLNNLPSEDEVTTDNKAAIEAARKAYEALSEDQKQQIPESKLKKLEAVEVALVNSILNDMPDSGDVTMTDKETIEAARKAYEALSEEQKQSVDKGVLEKLEAAEAVIAEEETKAAINDLPPADEVTTDNKAAIEAARKAYEALSEEQKQQVPENVLKKLEEAEVALVNSILNDMPDSGEVSMTDKEAIEAARKAYEALSEEQKQSVDKGVLEKLEAAEAVIAEEETKAAINDLPHADEVTTDNKAVIEAARKAYDELSDEQKEKLGEQVLAKLEAAESALTIEETKVEINNLPTADKVTADDKAAIEAARKAYNALSPEEKAKVPAETLKKLEDAEKALANAGNKSSEDDAAKKKEEEAKKKEEETKKIAEEAKKKEEADTSEAKKVIGVIGKLPVSDKVTIKDKAAIEAARKAYNALTADQKKKVSATELKKLTDAEKALSEAEKKNVVKQAELAINAGLKISQTGSKINIKWGKVSQADGYNVYVAYSGMKFGKPVKTINKNSTVKLSVTKINGKKINLKKNFKVYVEAYKKVGGKKEIVAKTITGHVIGRKNSKYTNAKKITLSKSSYSISVGKTAKIKAKTVLVQKSKKKLTDAYAKEFRYASSDDSIATVDKNGKIKGISKGTCTIYVYSRNGYAKKVSVTVK